MPTLAESSLPAEYLLARHPDKQETTQIGRFGPMQTGTLAGHGRRADWNVRLRQDEAYHTS
jgi:hypothetical protein